MTSSNTNEALQAIDKELAPKLARHTDDIAMNAALFARIKAVHEARGGATRPAGGEPEVRRWTERAVLWYIFPEERP